MARQEQKRIFKLFLDDISENSKASGAIDKWLRDEYDDLQFNGRQIRNIVSSAMDLARAEHSKLEPRHLKTMWSVTRNFREYLQEQTYRAKDRQE
jgi:hypothetical protein